MPLHVYFDNKVGTCDKLMEPGHTDWLRFNAGSGPSRLLGRRVDVNIRKCFLAGQQA